MYGNMLKGMNNTSFSMSLLDGNDNPYSVTVNRVINYSTWYSWARDPNLTSAYFITECGYGYVNMDLLQPSQVPDMYEALKDAPSIIFDLRNYPNGTLWDIGPLLFPGPIISAIYQQPALAYNQGSTYYYYYFPGWYYEQNDLYNLGSWSNPDAYNGNVYILVNQETQSQAEYTCQYFSHHPNSRVFGTQTAGADGNISYLTLPSGITTYFTSLGWYYSDYYQQQRNGVKIDTVVSPTREGLRQGIDEILLAALDCLTGADDLATDKLVMQVFPNPVTENRVNIFIQLEENTGITVSLFDLTGKLVVQQNLNTHRGLNQFVVLFPELTSGMYLLNLRTGSISESRKLLVP
jgi:C-terminal processing protease CtpA/Prc